ncbi:MAG: hypothetical protein KDD58_16055 [Bdellovibrionales bacterium]|nr:hypothetical protein [Bdellovibrionales bacterium]
MNLIILFLAAFSVYAQDCPYELSLNDKSYCLDFSWQNAEKNINGKWEASDKLSPQIIKSRTPGKKKLYSAMDIQIWEKLDSLQTPVKIENFRVFTYMEMLNGHHHGGSYEFTWNEQGFYTLNKMNLMAMEGCWQLRWTLSDEDEMSTSQKIMNIENFVNYSDQENAQQMIWCSMCRTSPGSEHKH